jgi:hypothetical protein
MKTQSIDTNEKAEKFLIEKLRTLPSWRKVEMVKELTVACQKMALIGLRDRYPNADDRELQLRLASLWLDRETMIKAFSWDPEKMGL